MRQPDINFALTILLNALVPPHKTAGSGSSHKMQHLTVGEMGRVGSVTSHHKRALPKENLLNVVFLGLKIMVVCFEKQMSSEWHRVAKAVQDLGNKLLGKLC